MTREMDLKLSELFASPAFQAEARSYATAEDLQKGLAAHGIQMNAEEVNELLMAIGKKASENGDELNEENLEGVAGGSWVVIGCIALGVVCVGALGLGIYNGYQKAKRENQ